jgi:hypothetical protein
MAVTAKEKRHRRRSAERPVLYRGIKIVPMNGTRSALAQAIRDGLRAGKTEESLGDPAQE